MSKSEPRLELKHGVGKPQTIGGLTIRPESQALILRWPRGAWVWNRPVAIRIERADGTQERMPIVDVTRTGQWALGGLAAAFAFVSVLLSIKSRAKSNPNRRLEHE